MLGVFREGGGAPLFGKAGYTQACFYCEALLGILI